MHLDKKGKVTSENRYDVRNWNDRPKPQPHTNISYDNSQMLGQFVGYDVSNNYLYIKWPSIRISRFLFHLPL